MDTDIKNYDFIKQLSELEFIDAIWLYGSRANNTNRPRSDIDLAIIAPRATEKEWRKVEEIMYQPDTLLGIDLIRFDKLKPNAEIRSEILKNHEILFERGNE